MIKTFKELLGTANRLVFLALGIVLLMLCAGRQSVAQVDTAPCGDKDLAAYLRIPAERQPDYECFVRFFQPPNGWAELSIIDAESKSERLHFRPVMGHFIRWFTEELTGDWGEWKQELITVWAMGVANQVVIVKLYPTPKIVFDQGYRHFLSIRPGSLTDGSLPPSIVLYSGTSNYSPVQADEYRWSEAEQTFRLVSSKIVEEPKE